MTVKEFFASLAGVVTIIVMVIALIVGGVWLYWGVIAPGVAQGQYTTNRNSQQFQAATIAHERDLVLAYQSATDAGQKKTIAEQFCQTYADLTVVPTDLTTAHQQICN